MNQQLEIDWGEDSPFPLSTNMILSESNGGNPDGETFLADVLDPSLVNGSQELMLGNGMSEDATHRRIRQLEKALEQCQHYIYELKSQMVDQAFLEAQLAATEEFSHIQKQAIVTLKGRQSSQAELDQNELDNLRQENLALIAQLETVAGQSESQSAEIHDLQDQLRHKQAVVKQVKDEADRLLTQNELSQGAAVQETQQRIIAQTTAERLRNSLRENEATIQSLEAQLQQTLTTATEQKEIIAALKSTKQQDSHKNQAIQNLSSTLLKAQTKIAELESNLSNAGIVQAQFQHSTQEYEAQTLTLQERSEQLEQQVAEMQEQILQQAQQASEYETAVQHWKDRSLESEQVVGQMKHVLEYLLCDRNNNEPLSDQQVEDAITEIAASLPEQKFTESNRKGPMLDLPSIMTRWRSAKS